MHREANPTWNQTICFHWNRKFCSRRNRTFWSEDSSLTDGYMSTDSNWTEVFIVAWHNQPWAQLFNKTVLCVGGGGSNLYGLYIWKIHTNHMTRKHNRTCMDCDKRPSFGKPDEKPTHCTEHKLGHYINVVTKRSPSAGCGCGDEEWGIRSISFPRFEPISLTVDNMLEFLRREQHPNFSHFCANMLFKCKSAKESSMPWSKY